MSQFALLLEVGGVLTAGVVVAALVSRWIDARRHRFASEKPPVSMDARLEEILNSAREVTIREGLGQISLGTWCEPPGEAEAGFDAAEEREAVLSHEADLSHEAVLSHEDRYE